MTQFHLLPSHAGIRIRNEELRDEILSLVRDTVPRTPLESNNAGQDLVLFLHVIPPLEREAAGEHEVNHHPQTPHVALSSVAAFQNFRRHVRRGTTYFALL